MANQDGKFKMMDKTYTLTSPLIQTNHNVEVAGINSQQVEKRKNETW